MTLLDGRSLGSDLESGFGLPIEESYRRAEHHLFMVPARQRLCDAGKIAPVLFIEGGGFSFVRIFLPPLQVVMVNHSRRCRFSCLTSNPNSHRTTPFVLYFWTISRWN